MPHRASARPSPCSTRAGGVSDRGTDVVVGYVEDHGRPATAAQIRDLEIIPRATLTYRDQQFEEMDIDAVLARKPRVALVDELAHTNVPGSRNEKRWQDIEELLAAGINVISTVNIQHLESLNDVVEEITGIVQRETVPDAVVRAADQIELVDMTPEALRRRMAHGNVYAADKVDAALANYFRVGNLSALRELALLWVADRVDEGLEEYRERHGITAPWETRERVVVALTGAPDGDRLVRRGARLAARTKAELVGVHVRSADGLATPNQELLERHRALLQQLGGRYAEVTGTDVADALVRFARAENSTQIVLGATQRSRWAEMTKGSVINRVISLASRRRRPRHLRRRSRDRPAATTAIGAAPSPAAAPPVAGAGHRLGDRAGHHPAVRARADAARGRHRHLRAAPPAAARTCRSRIGWWAVPGARRRRRGVRRRRLAVHRPDEQPAVRPRR